MPSADVVPPVISKQLPSGVMRVPVPSAAGTMGSAAIAVTLRRVKRVNAISDRIIVLAPNFIRLQLLRLTFVTLSQSRIKNFSTKCESFKEVVQLQSVFSLGKV